MGRGREGAVGVPCSDSFRVLKNSDDEVTEIRSGEVGDEGAFRFEKEGDFFRLPFCLVLDQRFIIRESLAKDEVAILKMVEEFFRTFVEKGSQAVVSIRDDGNDVRQSDESGVLHRGVVNDRFPTDGDGDPVAEPLEEKFD